MNDAEHAQAKKVKNKLVERLSYHLALPLRREVEATVAKQGCATYSFKFKRYSATRTLEAKLVSANEDVAELTFPDLPTVPSQWPKGDTAYQKLVVTFPKGRVNDGSYFAYSTADRTILAMQKAVDMTVKFDGTTWKFDAGRENAAMLEDLANHLEMYREVLENTLESAVERAYEPLASEFEEMSGLKLEELAWQALTYDPEKAIAFFEYNGFADVPAKALWPRVQRDEADAARWLGGGWTLEAKPGDETAWSFQIDYANKRFIKHQKPQHDG